MRAIQQSPLSAVGDDLPSQAHIVHDLAPHRRESIEACHFCIDSLKLVAPIWKKEHYEDGDSGWVNCERCAAPAAVPSAMIMKIDTSQCSE